MNDMAVNSELLTEYVDESRIRGFISELLLAVSCAILDDQRIADIVEKKYIRKLKTA